MSKRCAGCMELFGDEFEICPHCGYVVGTHAEEAIHMEPGTILHDRYIIGKVIGFGGFGVTYIGWDGKLEQKVAIKEYLPGEFSTRMPGQSQVTVFNGDKSEQFRDGLNKFVEEAKRVAKFQNEPGIVKVFDSFEENDTAYIVMEYLDGETLTELLKREKTIPEDKAVAMLLPIMESLQVVHAEGVLHRDIAPDNIFLTKSGEVKLIDFGASRYATTSHSRSLTVIIKPGYSPEEQYRSRGDQGPYTDVYAIAATLYKMITGKTPPDAMERRAKYETQSKDILEEPHKLNKNISINRENAILNAMNVRIEDRTPDIETFISELNANPPAKRRYGKIKKINLYLWPLWLKILIPVLLVAVVTFGVLLLTGVINFSRYTKEVVIPDNIVIAPDVEGLYHEEAIASIEENELLAAIEGSVDSKYIAAGKIIIQKPVGGVFMERNGKVMLTVSSGNGVEEPVNGIATVPYLIGDQKEKALEKLKKAGLGEVKIEEVYDDNIEEGLVIKSSLKSGEKVDIGTSLTLSISKGTKPFGMPNVVGKNKDEAKTALEEKGLVVKIEFQGSATVPENCVISQSNAANTDVKRGQEITLIVSSGEKLIKVADVVGKTKDIAQSELDKQGFAVYIRENTDDNVPAGSVISQSPAAGTSQIQGSTITLFISTGKKSLTVSYDGNGGSASKSSDTRYANDTYGELPGASRSGYSFSGWYTSSEGGSRVDSSTKLVSNSNHTLYAHWSRADFTVSLDANGGSVSPSSISVSYGSSYSGLPTPSRKGYSFDGWYTSSGGGSRVDSGTEVNTASNHTLYAQWSPKKYTITFDSNGGTVSESSRSVAYQSAYGTLPTPKRNYYTFQGWYNSSGNKANSDTIMGAGNVSLTARWKIGAESDWVPASEVPAGVQITAEKYTYTHREYKTSSGSSMSGWTKYDTKRTSWGGTQGPVYSNPSNGSRNVWSEQYVSSYTHHWKYYHRYGWGYNVSTGTNGNVWSTDAWLPSGARHNIDLTYALPVYQNNWAGSGQTAYKDYRCEHDSQSYVWFYDGEYDTPNYATRWYYQEPVYTYYFYKDTNNESTSDPSGQTDVSNVQKWVKYRNK